MRPEQLADAIRANFPNVKGEFPELKICCPLCGDTRFRLGINVVRKTGHCFNCAARLNATALCDALGLSSSVWYEPTDFDSLGAVLEGFNKNDRQEEIILREDSVGPLDAITFAEASGSKWIYLWRLATEYLINRGYDAEKIARKYNLLLPSPASREKHRLILPVYEDGELVYYQARALTDGQYPKYLNPPKTPNSKGKSHYVFNLDEAKKYREVIICEGIFSAISTGPNAVAIFGKELSDVQANKILRAGFKSAIIMLDAGEEEAAEKAASKLYSRIQTFIAHLPYGDPDEVTLDERVNAILNCEPFSDFEAALRVPKK